MSATTIFDIYGQEFNSFWSKVRETYPDMPIVYYEVLVDFMDDFYDENLPLQENMKMAYDYLCEHKNDYN